MEPQQELCVDCARIRATSVTAFDCLQLREPTLGRRIRKAEHGSGLVKKNEVRESTLECYHRRLQQALKTRTGNTLRWPSYEHIGSTKPHLRSISSFVPRCIVQMTQLNILSDKAASSKNSISEFEIFTGYFMENLLLLYSEECALYRHTHPLFPEIPEIKN